MFSLGLLLQCLRRSPQSRSAAGVHLGQRAQDLGRKGGCKPAKTGAGLTQGWDGTIGHTISMSRLKNLELTRPIVTIEQFTAWEEESNYGGW